MAVSKSEDGGITWSQPIMIVEDDNPRFLNDKNSLTADPTDADFVYAVWDKLGKDGQTALEVWYSAAYDAMRREADLQDRAIVEKYSKGSDVKVVDWAQGERDKFREISVKAWEDFAKKTPLAKEALDAHIAYMKKTGMLK